MADQAALQLTSETSLTPTDAFILQRTAATTRTTSATLSLMGGLRKVDVANVNVTGVVGVFHRWDSSQWSANRTYTLPTVAKIDERCGFYLDAIAVPTEHSSNGRWATVRSGAAGDFIGGLDCSSTPYRRLNQQGAFFVFRCAVATPGAMRWIVDARWQGTGRADDPPDGFRPVFPDDATDNTAAINALTQATRDVVTLPAGDVRCTGVLYPQGLDARSGGVLAGVGRSEDEDVNHTATILKFTGQQVYGIWLGGQAYRIRDLTLQGAATDTWASGNQTTWAVNVGKLGSTGLETGIHKLDNVFIRNFKAGGGGVFFNDYANRWTGLDGATTCNVSGTAATLIDANAWSDGTVTTASGVCTFTSPNVPATAANMAIRFNGAGTWYSIATRDTASQVTLDDLGVSNGPGATFQMQVVWPAVSTGRSSGNAHTTPYLLVGTDIPWTDPANPPQTIASGLGTNVLTLSGTPADTGTGKSFQFWYYSEAQSAHCRLDHIAFRDTPTCIRNDNNQSYAHVLNDISIRGTGNITDCFIDCHSGGNYSLVGFSCTERDVDFLKLGTGVSGNTGSFAFQSVWLDGQAAESPFFFRLVNDTSTATINVVFRDFQISTASGSGHKTLIRAVRPGTTNPARILIRDSAFLGSLNASGNIHLDGGTAVQGELFLHFIDGGVSADHITPTGDNYIICVEEAGNKWFKVNAVQEELTFGVNDATPDVGGTATGNQWRRPFHNFKVAATSTTNITNFDGGHPSMEIVVRGNATPITIEHDITKIATRTAANITVTENQAVKFKLINGIWYQLS